jgi:alpha-galactosidase/6-phospho-beta-glucosidase family protein
MLARVVNRYHDVTPARAEIKVNVLGINHFTWIDRATYQGLDVLPLLHDHLTQPGVIRSYTRAEVESWADWFRSADQVKFVLLQRFGILAAAGDRHLVEFLPGFIRSPEELFRWGVIRTPVAWRIERWRNAPQKTRDLMAGREPLVLQSTGEEGVPQIKALLGLGELVTNVNVENQGQVASLPLHAVVETNAYFSRDEVRPITAGALPAGVQTLISRHVANQEAIIEAALTRDTDLAFQAVFNDPTNRLPLDEAWVMFNQLLRASRAYLPGWNIH